MIITTTRAFRSHPRASGLVSWHELGLGKGKVGVTRLLVLVSRAVRAAVTEFAEFLA